MRPDILIVGGYGEVGRRLTTLLEAREPGRVMVAGRHPEHADGVSARHIDLDDPASIERALEGVGVVVACTRQREPHLLRAAVRRGLAYTSIAPPRLPVAETNDLREQAKETGARIVLATGLQPGISSMLARSAVNRLGGVDTIETSLLLSLGDAYGADSMAYIFEEVARPYSIMVAGRERETRAFEQPLLVTFPAPIGRRRAYAMPFTDQFHYPATIGTKTAIGRIALDPPWLADLLSALLRAGLRRALTRGDARGRVHGLIEKLRRRYAGRDHFALLIEARRGSRTIRSTLVGRQQASATAIGAAAITEALWSREVAAPGVWLAEEIVDPDPFFARLAAQGIVPVTDELRSAASAETGSSVGAGHASSG